MTNAEKFEDVFGFIPNENCIIPQDMCAPYSCVYVCQCAKTECPYENWWEQEYEQPEKLPFD